jgi:hypothetical protein
MNIKPTTTRVEDLVKHTAQRLCEGRTITPRDIVVACLADKRIAKPQHALAVAQRLNLGRKAQRDVVALASGQ